MKTTINGDTSQFIALLRESNVSIAEMSRRTGIYHRTIENWLYENVVPSWDKACAVLNAIGYEISIIRRNK